MKSSFGALPWICVMAALVLTLPSVRAQELSFTLIEQLVIGNNEDAPAEYLFTFPELVRTDSRGYIYVHDRRRADIRVFDKSGQYVTTIGKRGEGPGEMREIVGMHVDAWDRLVVADRISRRFTIFSDLGAQFETKSFTDDLWGVPSPILSLEDSFVLRYVRAYDDPERKLPYIIDTKTLHHYDMALNSIEAFAELGEIFNLNEPFEKAESDTRSALRMATNGIDKIVLVPTIYNGYAYRYTHKGGSWDVEKLEGGPVPREPYMSVSQKEFDANPELQRSSISIGESSGVHHAKIFNWSLGVVILSSGEIVNFTMQTPLRGELRHRVELFDRAGVLLGYGPLRFDDQGLNRSVEVMTKIDILWIDQDDRLYVRRRSRHGFYILSVAELVIGRP
ncbi:MAG: 6-bladed beta-propeller [Rhodothermaceae bacterium]|nr:6-bladed beta-propeller [Rhodothermaceae bacterium]MXX58873.1 6-bladed beta-propeller [Rhodothermaceae bacterium]MYD18902.1 6-bladed beta-propeller [Rhodothermaceae bacterium]MYD55536.1 6-bladed beta-propeller [Rhodothermaceae bacterium]MYI44548.1 6-bladed beta-propeller [Rhodothermaceae bacterium]